jgi:hypothetical protein
MQINRQPSRGNAGKLGPAIKVEQPPWHWRPEIVEDFVWRDTVEEQRKEGSCMLLL